MSVSNVKSTIARVTADKVLDKKDAEAILQSAGSSISSGEEKAIKDSFKAGGGINVAGDAKTFLQGTLRDLASLRMQAESQNAVVKQRAPQLEAAEKARMKEGVKTVSLGGTEIPEDVKKIVNAARAAGAVAYDVAELGEPAKDDHGEGYAVTGRWSPYPQEIAATGNMAFSYTEITPKKLDDDMKTEQTFNRVKGYRTQSQTDFRTGQKHDFQVAEFEKVTAKGSGDITAHYDEASYPDCNARVGNNQKWANNFSIMSDGTLHCIPAARRNQAQPGLILTNPSLGRGERMLFNGHIEVRGGVVTSIGMSGRLQSLVNDGEAKFVDPIAVLKAWGFKMAPGLRVNFEGSGPDPKIDPNSHVIG